MWDEIRRGWQEAAMGVSGQGELFFSPKTQNTKRTMKFGKYSIKCGYEASYSSYHINVQ